MVEETVAVWCSIRAPDVPVPIGCWIRTLQSMPEDSLSTALKEITAAWVAVGESIVTTDIIQEALIAVASNMVMASLSQ